MNSSEAQHASSTPTISPIEISFPAPKILYTNIHVHLTFYATSTLLFLTSTSLGESSTAAKPMGSFVYAMPDRTNPRNTICTSLCTSSPSSIDYATRTARILARKMNLPIYVGCSMDFAGSTVEEEMEGLTKIVETVMTKWQEHKDKANES